MLTEIKKTLIKLAPKLDQTAFSKNSNQTNTELPDEVKKIKHQAYLEKDRNPELALELFFKSFILRYLGYKYYQCFDWNNKNTQ